MEFLLEHAARYLARDPRAGDVLSAFAGLRPLVRPAEVTETARISREHSVLVSNSGLITITGGKWTTYRRMGADVVDQAIGVGGLAARPCTTETLTLHGGEPSPPDGSHLSVYGADRPALSALLDERAGWKERLHPRLPYLAGEVVWAARHEHARTVEDVLARRTRALFLDARASQEAAPEVAALLAEALGRDPGWKEDQVRGFCEVAEGYRISP